VTGRTIDRHFAGISLDGATNRPAVACDMGKPVLDARIPANL
jgi:hypothetical protein